MNPTVFVLVFTTLVQGVGPVTSRTEFTATGNLSALEACLQEKQVRTMAAGDRMMHAHCEGLPDFSGKPSK